MYFLLLLLIPQVFADDFNCKFQAGGHDYDFTPFNSEHTVSREHFDTPSTFTERLTFNLCDTLKKTEASEKDQCPEGTRACLIESNKKEGVGGERITRVIPLATNAEMAIKISSLSNGVNFLMHGPVYPPHQDSPAEMRNPQSFNISVLCPSAGAEKSLSFVEYRSGQASVVALDQVACADTPKPDDDASGGGGSSSGGSGVGYFFLAIFLMLGAYFILGAYYNYNKYGASGWDLVPHRDFWREVPFLIRDVFNHLCSSIRPRGGSLSSRGGYVQV